jgi:hypothetical protein
VKRTPMSVAATKTSEITIRIPFFDLQFPKSVLKGQSYVDRA